MIDKSKVNGRDTSPLKRLQQIEKSSASFAKAARFQRSVTHNKKKSTTIKESPSKTLEVKDIDDATKISITPAQRKIYISQLRAAQDDNSGVVGQNSSNSVVNRRREYLTQRSSQSSMMDLYKTPFAGGSRTLSRGNLKKAMERIDLDRRRKAEILQKEIMITHQNDSIANTDSGGHGDKRSITDKRDSNVEKCESNNEIQRNVIKRDSNVEKCESNNEIQRNVIKRDSNVEKCESSNEIQWNVIKLFDDLIGIGDIPSDDAGTDGNHATLDEIEWPQSLIHIYHALVGEDKGRKTRDSNKPKTEHLEEREESLERIETRTSKPKAEGIEERDDSLSLPLAVPGEDGARGESPPPLTDQSLSCSKSSETVELARNILAKKSVSRARSHGSFSNNSSTVYSRKYTSFPPLVDAIETRTRKPKAEDIEERDDSLSLPLAVNNALVPGEDGARESTPSLTDQSLGCSKSSETVELARNILAKKSVSRARSHGSFSNNSSTVYSRKYASFPPLVDTTPPTRLPRVPAKSKGGSEDFTNKAAARDIVKKRSFSVAERYKAFPPLQSESIGTSCSDSRQTNTHSSPRMKHNFGSKDTCMKSESRQLTDQGRAHRNESFSIAKSGSAQLTDQGSAHRNESFSIAKSGSAQLTDKGSAHRNESFSGSAQLMDQGSHRNESSSIVFAIGEANSKSATNTSSLPPANESKDRSEEHVQFNSIIHGSSSRNYSYEVEDGPTAEHNGRFEHGKAASVRGASDNFDISVQSDNYSRSYKKKDTVLEVQTTESGETEFRVSSTISRLHDFSIESDSIFQDHNDHVTEQNRGGLVNVRFDEEPTSEWKDPVLVAKVTDHMSSNGISFAREAIWDAGNGIEVDYNSLHSFSQFDKESGSESFSRSFSRSFRDSGTGTGTGTGTHSYSHGETHSYSQSTSMNDFSNSRSVANRTSTKSIEENSSYDANSCMSEGEEDEGEDNKNFFACF